MARKVFESAIPIVSAVGHETDFSLCDMAADLRAPTPSAAAELVVRDKNAVVQYIDNYEKHIFDILKGTVKEADMRLSVIESGIKAFPFRIITGQAKQRVESLEEQMRQSVSAMMERRQMFIEKMSDSLEDLNPKKVLQRGYAIVYDENKKVVTSSKGKEKQLDIELHDGHIYVQRKG